MTLVSRYRLFDPTLGGSSRDHVGDIAKNRLPSPALSLETVEPSASRTSAMVNREPTVNANDVHLPS